MGPVLLSPCSVTCLSIEQEEAVSEVGEAGWYAVPEHVANVEPGGLVVVEVPARLERHLKLCCWHGVAACSECVDERAGFIVARLDSADPHGPVARSLCEEGWCSSSGPGQPSCSIGSGANSWALNV